MYRTAVFKEGGYRYIPSVFQYSGGVAAEPGFQLEQVGLNLYCQLKMLFVVLRST